MAVAVDLAVRVAPAGAWLLGAAEGGGSPDVTALVGLINYGVLGALTILWLARRIVTAGELAQAVARAEAAETRERELERAFRAELVPAVIRFTDTATRVLERGEHARGDR